jgi:hypothetical protein
VLLPRHGADVDRQRAQEYVENGAAGDAAASPGWPLTPVASLEGEVVAANLLEGNHETPDYTGVPSAVFTIPELARVGLLEAEAREQGLDVDVRFTDMSDWYSIERVGERHAAAEVLVERGSADRRRAPAEAGGERADQRPWASPCARGLAPRISSGWSAPVRRAAPTSAISCSTRRSCASGPPHDLCSGPKCGEADADHGGAG